MTWTCRGLTKKTALKTICFPFADGEGPESQTNTAKAGREQAAEKGAKGISNNNGVSRVADDKHQL